MGIPGFYAWLRRHPHIVSKMYTERRWVRRKDGKFVSIVYDSSRNTSSSQTDTLGIDMNGMFHEAAQRAFRYGQFSKNPKFKRYNAPPPDISESKGDITDKIRESYTPEQRMSLEFIEKYQHLVVDEACSILEDLVRLVSPRRRLLLMVDGVCPVSKIQQQRMRRYRSAIDSLDPDNERLFDTSAISPGTPFMIHLNSELCKFVKSRVESGESMWTRMNIVYSCDGVPGEGEHKIFNFMRKFGKPGESVCVYGLDADIIFLSMISQIQSSITHSKTSPYTILRMCEDNTYDIVSVPNVQDLLTRMFSYEFSFHSSSSDSTLDAVFVTFLLGNDFIPNLGATSLMDKGLEILREKYIEVVKQIEIENFDIDLSNASLSPSSVKTKLIPNLAYNSSTRTFNVEFMRRLFEHLAFEEAKVIRESYAKGDKFKDDLLEKYSVKDAKAFDFDGYVDEYYATKMVSIVDGSCPKNIEEVCHHYLRGMEWTMRYYTEGSPPSWDWTYPYQHPPFSRDILKSLDTYTPNDFPQRTKPREPFVQLLSVIPPQSRYLLPQEFHYIFDSLEAKVETDRSGKKYEYQELVILPPLPLDYILKEYSKIVSSKIRKFGGNVFKKPRLIYLDRKLGKVMNREINV